MAKRKNKTQRGHYTGLGIVLHWRHFRESSTSAHCYGYLSFADEERDAPVCQILERGGYLNRDVTIVVYLKDGWLSMRPAARPNACSTAQDEARELAEALRLELDTSPKSWTRRPSAVPS